MNLKAIQLVILTSALALLVGCGGNQSAATPTTIATRAPSMATPIPNTNPADAPTTAQDSTKVVEVHSTSSETTPIAISTLVPSTVKKTGAEKNEVAKEEVAPTPSFPENVGRESADSLHLTDEQNQCLENALGISIMEELATREPTEQELIHFSPCGVDINSDYSDSKHHQGDRNSEPYGIGSAALAFNASEYPKMYRDTIKGIWEPGAWDQLARFVSDTSGQERLESLGINTVSVVASFNVLEGGEHEFPFTIAFIETEIARYKKLGFAVFLSGNSRGAPSDVNPEQALENYLLSCKRAAVELAEVAERYNVEYFSPNNEFEGSLADEAFPSRFRSYNPPETPFEPTDPGTDMRVEAASGWFNDILPDLKHVFSGKIIAKVGEAHPAYRVEGYDYIAFTIDHHNLTQADFRRLIRKQYKDIAASAAMSGVSWMVGEAYFHYGDEGLDLDASTKSFLKDMQQHYFDISLDEYLNFDHASRPSGYIFIGYFMDGIEIKDSDSETIIRNYFTLMT